MSYRLQVYSGRNVIAMVYSESRKNIMIHEDAWFKEIAGSLGAQQKQEGQEKENMQ